MKNALRHGGFDQLDHVILEELQANGRISVADLARKIFLSQPAVHNRIKRLERAGIIRRYAAILDRQAAGYDLLAFIRISIGEHTRDRFECWSERVADLPEVLECYRTAGSYDLLLKVTARDSADLDRFIAAHLMTLPGVAKIETSLALNEMKSTTAIKIGE
jgi:Lrp/AsnC family leucine-responsive transcriptional regulator